MTDFKKFKELPNKKKSYSLSTSKNNSDKDY